MRLKWKTCFQLGGLLLFVVVIFIVVWQTGIIQNLFPKAGGIPANIFVDTQAVLGQMPTPWRYLAQGGEESESMLDDVTGLVKALKPEYIRIDHLYDHFNVVGRDGEGKLTFDWTNLDKEVNAILATGAKPFLALSYMPEVISSGDIVAPPKNYGDWSTVVARTVAHYSGTGGKNIANVYYEVWNEPDLFGTWRVYGDRNYLNLYSSAVAGAVSVRDVQPFKIGGPAITGLYQNWFDTLVKYTSSNNVRLDFFSWHRYSTDLGQFFTDMSNARAWLETHPERSLDLELVITEWGHNSEVDKGYDGVYGAAHTMAGAMEMVNLVDKAFVFEIKDGPDPAGQKYWGRWGLLTHESQGITAKPRYYALKMLNELAPNRLSLTGKGTWVKGLAAQDGNTAQVLLANYDPKAQHTELVPVTFTNLMTQNFLLEESWLSGKKQSFNLATTAAELKHEVMMPVNSAVMLKLTPQ